MVPSKFVAEANEILAEVDKLLEIRYRLGLLAQVHRGDDRVYPLLSAVVDDLDEQRRKLNLVAVRVMSQGNPMIERKIIVALSPN